MIYEWYTGSDGSKQIAREFEKVYFRSRGKLTPEAIISRIEELAKSEGDVNMRAKFLTAAARLRLQQPGATGRGPSMTEVVELYDPLAANFPWVVTDYLEACLWAAIETGKSEGDNAWLSVAHYVFPLALWHQGRLDRTTTTWAVRAVAESFLELGKRFSSRVLLEMAVVAAIRAHHWDPDEPATLELLVEAYKLLGNRGAEARIFRDLCELEPKRKAKAQGVLRKSIETMLLIFGLRKESGSYPG